MHQRHSIRVPLHAPAIWATQLHRTDTTVSALLCLDDRIVARFTLPNKLVLEDDDRVIFSEAPEQTHAEMHAALTPALGLLGRVDEWMRIGEGGDIERGDLLGVLHQLIGDGTVIPPAPEFGIVLHYDLRELPDAPYYVLADDATGYFGRSDEHYFGLRYVVPCADETTAQRAIEQLRRVAVEPPYGYENPRYGNLRVTNLPPIPQPGFCHALVPTGARSWLWREREDRIPDDRALFVPTFGGMIDVEIGEFSVPDGILIVKDPSYDDTFPKPHKSTIRVLPGRYRATVSYVRIMDGWGGADYREAAIHVRHVAFADTPVDFQESCAVVPVDSGRAAVFCAQTMPYVFGSETLMQRLNAVIHAPKNALPDPWHGLTYTSGDAIVDDAGFAIHTGWGDGEYHASPARIGEHIVGFTLPFIEDALRIRFGDETIALAHPYWTTAHGQAKSYLHTLASYDALAAPDESVLAEISILAYALETHAPGPTPVEQADLRNVAAVFASQDNTVARRTAIILTQLLDAFAQREERKAA